VKKIVEDRQRRERMKHSALIGDLDTMAELAAGMREVRLKRGSLDFDLPEPEILLDMRGRPEAIIRAERSFAHMMIEEFMIAANEAVATELAGRGTPCLYRIHEKPDEQKVDNLVRSLRLPGLRLPKGASGSDAIRRVLDCVRGGRHEEVVTYLVLRTLKQARYSEVNAGHFGLASKRYLHFTSPIRRYPDLLCHRVLAEAISGRGLSGERKEELGALMPEIAFSSSRLERTAMEAERDVVDAMRAWFMKDKVGEEFEARITGVSPNGLRIRLVEFYVEGFIPVSDLTDDYYLYDEGLATLQGRHKRRSFSFGQEVAVRVERVDLDERRLQFAIYEYNSTDEI
jgi:ribonuclease R